MNEIRIKNVSKNISKNRILHNIDLTLGGGIIYGLYGPNGSGKTMLIRAIAGLMKPSDGTITYNDSIIYKDIDFIPDLGILIENIGLYPEFNGYKNLELLSKIRNTCKKDDIKKYMNKLGLSADDKRKVKKYSLGMKQKLAIVQAFMENPKVLLLDEPTNALDEITIKTFYEMCRNAAKNEAIVVIASHDKDVINNLCDIVFYISSGEIVKRVENK